MLIGLAGGELTAAAVALAALIVLHVLPTGLSAAHNPVSQYGISRYRRGYRVLTIALGLAGAGAAAVVVVTGPPTGRVVTVTSLLVFAGCRLVISWWPMDAPGQPRTTRGSVHAVVAFVTFGAITVAAGQLRRTVAQPVPVIFLGYRTTVRVAFWLLVAGLVALFVTRRLGHRYFGAAERVLYAGIFLLLFAIGLSGL